MFEDKIVPYKHQRQELVRRLTVESLTAGTDRLGLSTVEDRRLCRNTTEKRVCGPRRPQCVMTSLVGLLVIDLF